ncbi:Odorant receptor 73 [Frankliniella occidentalis]|nr:Odorant receptor 73 [Frankliniella occidentalis]
MLESGQPSRVDSWPLDEGPLSSHLRWWLKTLSPTGRDKFSARLLFWLRTSKIAMTTSVVTLLVGISDVAVSRSMHEASVPVTLSLGVYSSVFAHVLFVKRLPALLQTVALLLATTAGVERHLDSASQAFGLVCSFTAFYTMLPLVIVIYSTCADLHAALAHRMQVSATAACCPHDAALQSGVLRACIVADSALADLMPHLLVVSIIMPLFSTAELIASGLKLGAYSLGTAAPILIVFVPLCEVGDRLSRARRGVAESAAEGPWVEERPKQRQLRLAAAMGEGAFLRGSGIGPLDRATCGNALRSWFSFLQVILNVQRKAGVH